MIYSVNIYWTHYSVYVYIYKNMIWSLMWTFYDTNWVLFQISIRNLGRLLRLAMFLRAFLFVCFFVIRINSMFNKISKKSNTLPWFIHKSFQIICFGCTLFWIYNIYIHICTYIHYTFAINRISLHLNSFDFKYFFYIKQPNT